MRHLLLAALCCFFLLPVQDLAAKEYIVRVPWAEQAYNKKDYKTALRGFSRAIKKMEEKGQKARHNYFLRDYYIRRIAVLLRLRRKKEAAKRLIRLLKNEDISINLLWTEDQETVIEALGAHLKRKPKDIEALDWRATAYERIQKYDLAIADRTQAIKFARTKKERSLAYALRSWPLRLTKRQKEALADLTKSIELHPNADSYGNRSRVHERLGSLGEAIADQTIAIKLTEKSHKFYLDRFYRRARLYRKAKQPDQAMLDLNNTLIQKPDYSKAKGLRVVILNEQGKKGQALKELAALKNADPKFLNRPGKDLKPLLEELTAVELAVYLVPERGGAAWKMAQAATLLPFRHMLGKGTAKTQKRWDSLSAHIKKTAAKHKDLTPGGLEPIPEFTGSKNDRLSTALKFTRRQLARLTAVLIAEQGPRAADMVELSSVSNHIQVVTALGIRGAVKKLAKRFRKSAGNLALPETIWGSYLKAAEAGDKEKTKAEWAVYIKNIGKLLADNKKNYG